MIANNVIQADIVADAKLDANITAKLKNGSSDEVREDQYQGTQFGYPNIRVAIRRQDPIPNREQCDHARLIFSVMCYAEGGSSKACDELAHAVNARYHKRFFKADTWTSWLRSSGLNSAIRIANNLWRAECMFQGTVYPNSAQPTWHSP